MTITVSAPGKIHMLGEHAVVYGKPALLAAIDKRCRVSISPRKDSRIEIISKNFKKSILLSQSQVFDKTRKAQYEWEKFINSGDTKILFSITQDELDYVTIAVGEVLLYYSSNDSVIASEAKQSQIREIAASPAKPDPRNDNWMIKGFTLTIDSDIPVGAGLGSSAAVAVAVAAAISLFFPPHPDPLPQRGEGIPSPLMGEGADSKGGARLLDRRGQDEGERIKKTIYDIAFRIEQKKHGRPSGGDPATVLHGGLVWFRKETDDLKIIQSVPFTIPRNITKNFYLIDTGKPKESTGEMVSFVKKQFDGQPEKFQKIFDDQEQLTRELLTAIKNNNSTLMIRIIRVGEINLEKLGVVSPFAKKLIREIEKSGGAAKISGGGGKTKGTGMLLVYHKNRKILARSIKPCNMPLQQVKLAVEGLSYE